MKHYICAPGLPYGDETFPDVQPTSCITVGALKYIALPMMERTSERCRITLSPVDLINVASECSLWADFEMQSTLQNGLRSTAIIISGDEKVMLMALSPYSKEYDRGAL